MEATLVRDLPATGEWQFEPKWDGFRCIAFRDGDDVELQSKAGQALGRYFPEIVEAIAAVRAERFVIDGEIVIPNEGAFSFDALLQRIHPAASRVAKLSAQTPGVLMVFDLLADEHGESLLEVALDERRKRLEAFAKRALPHGGRVILSPVTRDRDRAIQWESELRGQGIDGLVAKRLDATYASGERTAMQKVKWLRTADCVVGGFRYGQKSREVGSLLLGLYDDDGVLHHVGFTANIPRSERASLTRKLESLVGGPGFTGRAPGGPSRWSRGRDTSWNPLKPSLVVEVQFDAFSEGRFRHGTSLVRFRPDKKPSQCTFEQVERPRTQPSASSLASQAARAVQRAGRAVTTIRAEEKSRESAGTRKRRAARRR
jgi:ATP-dependent DNA ligase